jgi:hypothetical protein
MRAAITIGALMDRLSVRPTEQKTNGLDPEGKGIGTSTQPLRHDALAAELAGLLVEDIAVADEMTEARLRAGQGHKYQ